MKIGPRMLLAGVVMSAACLATAQAATSDVPTRVKALNALLAEQWQHTLETQPEFATVLGDLRYNDRWTDASLAHQAADHRATEDFLKRFEAIDTSGFADSDKLNQQLMVRQLEDGIHGIDLKTYEMPIDQFNGLHLQLAQFVSAMPFDSTKHYDDYLKRLDQVPALFDTLIVVLKQGEKDKLEPP